MSKKSYSYGSEPLDVSRGTVLDVFLRTEYNYDTDAASVESGLECSDESRAKQAMKDETDINVIVNRFGLTGQMPQGVRMPTYEDFTLVTDFKSALDALTEADAAFMRMPAEVRSRFDNNAAAFVDFCSDEANRDEAIKLGLVPPAVAAGPDVGEVVSETSFAR